MKFLIPVMLMSLVSWSCQSGSSSDHNDHAHHKMPSSQEHSADEHHHDDTQHGTLELNNGEKWKADQPTMANAARIRKVVEAFEKKNSPSLSDHQKFGADIKSGIDRMIRECTMKGAEDQALHEWFFPLIDYTAKIGKADEEEARHLAHLIIDRVKEYDTYFTA